MTTERRQSSPEYREEVHATAEKYAAQQGHDYEKAAEYAGLVLEAAAGHPWREAFAHDVLSLLTRRAMTVKGATV